MIIKELIERLKEIEDKSLLVMLFNDKGEYCICSTVKTEKMYKTEKFEFLVSFPHPAFGICEEVKIIFLDE